MGWLDKKWHWAREKPLFWWNLVLVAATGFVVFIAPSPNGGDLRLRTFGISLELIGVLTVWLDLTATARHFGKPGVVDSTLRWIRAGFARQELRVGVATGSFTITGGRVRAKVRQTIRPEATLEERVSTLEALAKQIDHYVDKAYDEIDQRASELERKVRSEAATLAGEVAEVRKSLENAATGNFATLAFGVFWLAVGAVISTMSSEIVLLASGRWIDVWRAF